MLRATAALLCAAALAAGCARGPSGDVAVSRGPDQHAAEVAYAQMMLPHVEQGVELTEMVAGRTANPPLAQLVQSMNYVDVEEQGQLAGQLHLWSSPLPGENGMPRTTMPGMADQPTLDRLRALSGPAFDQMWLTVMITHHQGGVDMSRDYLSRGPDQALETLAQSQVQVGSQQIDQMRGLEPQ